MSTAELEVREVSKAFSGVHAVRGVSLSIGQGEARALIGENGAGKSTLVNIISAALKPDTGTVHLRGEEVRFKAPEAALNAGIGTVHQRNWLVPALTAVQNVELANEDKRRPLGRLSRRPRERSLWALSFVGLSPAAERPVGPMSLADRQLVAVARALSRGSRLMIFDEPSAALSQPETERLFAVIDRLRADGTAVLYLTHRLQELPRVAERVTVMRNGQVVATREASTPEPELIDLMSGHDTREQEQTRADARRLATRRFGDSSSLLSVEGLGDRAGAFSDVEFEIRPGEIVALVGLPDSGVTELTQVLAGARRAGGGRIRLYGREIQYASPRSAVGHGIGYLPGDRALKGAIPNLDVGQSITLTALSKLTSAGVIRSRKRERVAQEMVSRCQVRPPRLNRAITALSGGNQQKALFGRLVAADPTLMVCEEATGGVDVAGREALHGLIAQFCEQGNAVLWGSSDLREVALLSDRALIMWRGGLIGEIARDSLSVRSLMAAQFNRRGAAERARSGVHAPVNDEESER